MSKQLEGYVRQYYELDQQIKSCERAKSAMRDNIIELSEKEFSHNSDTKIVIAPQDLIDRIGVEEYISTRYPEYDLESFSDADILENYEIILKRNPKFIGGIIEKDKYKLSKTVKNSSDIDWENLEKDYPELYEKIVKKNINKILDEEGFREVIEKDPDGLEILSHYIISKKPIITIQAKKNDEQ